MMNNTYDVVEDEEASLAEEQTGLLVNEKDIMGVVDNK